LRAWLTLEPTNKATAATTQVRILSHSCVPEAVAVNRRARLVLLDTLFVVPS
jgi:hypothetical protein